MPIEAQGSVRPANPNPSYYRARYYDPATGRFLTEDPLRLRSGQINFYAYVYNNSPNLFDPRGLWGGGAVVSASGEAGLILGVAGTANAGAGIFSGGGCGCPEGINAGAFASAGGFVGGPGIGRAYPSSKTTFGKGFDETIGVFGGGGGGFFFSNAKCAKDLKGPFNNFVLDFSLPILPVSFSLTFSFNVSSGVGLFSATTGPGYGYGVSVIPTNTWTTN